MRGASFCENVQFRAGQRAKQQSLASPALIAACLLHVNACMASLGPRSDVLSFVNALFQKQRCCYP